MNNSKACRGNDKNQMYELTQGVKGEVVMYYQEHQVTGNLERRISGLVYIQRRSRERMIGMIEK